jgi:WD40 repeat protein/serine/threonine protein kinase
MAKRDRDEPSEGALDATRVERGSRPSASRPGLVEPTVVEGSGARSGDVGASATEPAERSGIAHHDLTQTEAFRDEAERPRPPEPEPILAVGTEVDHYRTMRLLGRGGMGEVYLARDTQLGRKVALKIVLADVLRDEGEKERFLFEARATAALNHAHIVTIYGAGEHCGRPYVALEYLEGSNLRERLRERELGLPETLRVASAIARALAHAHENGILHRDLKPANVVIAYDGRLRVVDFGLAKVLTEDVAEEGPSFIPGLTKLQESGEDTWTAGTPSYMAPEQWRGESGGAATDVWAFGVILFELCTGRKPFEGDSTVVLAAAVCAPGSAPAVVADVPRELANLVARCLDKKIEGRPSAQEVADVLHGLLDDQRSTPSDDEPFRGLLPFDEAQAGSFFGREIEVSSFVERLRLYPLLPVVGPSGAGKSSFVRAGVLPRLREQGDWRILEVRPQDRPFRALAAVLSDVEGGGIIDDVEAALRDEPAQLFLRLRQLAEEQDAHVLLFVDQMEELFTLAAPETARLFLEALYASADDVVEPIRVVFTLRQDFLDRLATEPRMSAALGHLMVIQRPGRDALERIVRRPIEMRGYRFEDAKMVEEMVDAVADSPACLPLLSFAARRLWEERDRDRELLLREAFDQMGGVGGALASHADGVISGLSRSERQVARQLLLRLVTGERTRKVVAIDAALDGLGERGRHVLDRLTAARLITVLEADAPMLELAHESLIETWHRLTRWVDESRDDLSFLEEVSQAAELWAKRGRRPEELWQGDALAEAWRAAERLSSRAPVLVVEFLERGKHHQRKHKIRRRVVVSMAFVALAVVAVGLGLQKREADRQRALAEIREAQSEQRRAQALREGARAAMGEASWLEARAKLRSALEIEDHPAARALWWQLSREPLRWRAATATTAYAVAYSPEGDTVAAACQDGAVYLVDAVERRTRLLRGHADQVFAVTFSPDGKRLASGSFGGHLRIWDRQSGKTLRAVKAHEGMVWAVAFSPSGDVVASSGGDHLVALWDAVSGERRGTLEGHDADVFGVAFSPDGKRIATGSFDQSVRIWTAAGKEIHRLDGHTGRVFSVTYSPDGQLIASASRDGSARIWRADDGALVRSLQDDSGLFGVTFSPDGKTLATSSRAGTVRLWDVATGKVRATLGHHDAVALAVAFSPDGRWVASGGDDRSLRLWSTSGHARDDGVGPHLEGVNRVEISPDGKVVATASHDNTIRLWRMDDGEPFRVLRGHDDTVRSVAFSPDGSRLVSGGHDRDLRIWNVANGSVERVLAGHSEPIFGVDFSPDGARVVSGSRDRTVRVWDVQSGRERHRLEGHTEDVRDVTFSPSGEWVVSASTDNTVRLWDAKRGAEKKVYAAHEAAAEGVAFRADSDVFASGGRDGAVYLHDVAAGTSSLLGRGDGRIYWIGFHPDGERVGAPFSTGVIRLLSAGGGAVRWRGHQNEANSVDFASDGRLAASGSDDGTVRTWRVDSGRPHWRAPVLAGSPLRLYSHRGWTLASSSKAASTPPDGWSASFVAQVEQRARQVVLAGDVACVDLGDALELWSPTQDAATARETMEVTHLLATRDGCVARAADRAVVANGERMIRLEVEQPLAVGATSDGVMVATDDAVVTFDLAGARVASQPSGPGIAALAEFGGALVVGYRDGHVERLGDARALPFETTPNAVPTAIARGPAGTIVIGYGDGTVGMWPDRGGQRLADARLHGSVLHVVARDRELHVASDLGQHLTWRLDAFHLDACDLLQEVWDQVPVVWEGGRAVASARPKGHRCAR